MGYNEFKSKYCSYYCSFESLKDKLSLFKNAFDKAIGYELPSRDDKQLFLIRDFTNSEGLQLNFCAGNLLCSYSDEEKKLYVGTLSPLWKRDWCGVSKDTFVSDQIEGFFYLVNQYIYRSSQINLIGAIALAYDRCCNFRGDSLSESVMPDHESVYNDFFNKIYFNETNRSKTLLHYLKVLNALDPFINKAICYYTRALDLKEHNFDEESITCADNMVDTIFQAIKQQLRLPTMQRKDMNEIIEKEILISKSTTEKLDNLYQLRCHFSAHPAQSKWWDFSEIYDTNIDAIMDSVKTILVKFCMYERNHCRIQRNPEKWSEWFIQNSDILFDAVWFHLLPPLR